RAAEDLLLGTGDGALHALDAALHDLRGRDLLGEPVGVALHLGAGALDVRPDLLGGLVRGAHQKVSFRVSTVWVGVGFTVFSCLRPLCRSRKPATPHRAATISAATQVGMARSSRNITVSDANTPSIRPAY